MIYPRLYIDLNDKAGIEHGYCAKSQGLGLEMTPREIFHRRGVHRPRLGLCMVESGNGNT